VGPPLDGARIRIGGDGRIEVSGPMVSPGYAGEPARAGEWFRTSDLGRLDERGRLTVLGRADAVIVTGGENIDPHEVERALQRHPGVRAVRVFGAPDPEWGQRVVAEVEAPGETVGSLAAWAERLPSGKRPREWRIVDALGDKLTRE
jgi:O-succinylbenzoic acid--CoA ligase